MTAVTEAWQESMWAEKLAWHARQRALPLRAKVGIIIRLQRQQQDINRVKAALGRPVVPMQVWDTRP